MENWFVINKGADFQGIGERFCISPVLARLIRNREVVGDEAIARYLNGGMECLYDPHLLKDADLLCEKLSYAVDCGKKIRIIGDYDIDGIMSTYIMYQGISRVGGTVDFQIPDRITDGYGLNENLIRRAAADGIEVIVTCDNGISAMREIALAKELGMSVLVTDHHEIPYQEEDGTRIYQKSEADAIVNPKQPDCKYPFLGLCGAAVAWKVIQVLYEKRGVAAEEAEAFLENVAFATVGDVMDLKDENRILVKEGLKRIRCTSNVGMRALILKNNLEPGQISAFHFGYVLGPCINASGRLDTAKLALKLFLEQDAPTASAIAAELTKLNSMRKDMTAEGVLSARAVVEAGNAGEKVYVIFLPMVHESLAGIIAGRIREAYNRPTFVLTRSEDGVKGSGRSVEGYSMYDELCKCSEFFTKFGGHPMAAGLSMREESVDAFREKINICCELTEADFIPKIKIDIPMPAGYPDVALVQELTRLEPYGKGNPKPLFADRDLGIRQASIVGKNKNVLKLVLTTSRSERVSAVYFGDVAAWINYYKEKYGSDELDRAFAGQNNRIRLSVVYDPQINRYQGAETIQLVIRNYR